MENIVTSTNSARIAVDPQAFLDDTADVIVMSDTPTPVKDSTIFELRIQASGHVDTGTAKENS